MIDAHLQQWDALARGDRRAAAAVIDPSNRAVFEHALLELLGSEDRAAPARLVFYLVVQQFGMLSLETALGAAAGDLVGDPNGALAREGRTVYVPADLYRWWKQNGARYEPLPLLERWESWERGRVLAAAWTKPQDPVAERDREQRTGSSRADAESPELVGSLPKETIRSVIESHLQEVRACYETMLARKPTLRGQATIKFMISPLGVVALAKMSSSDLGDAELDQCIVGAVRTWVFPQPDGGGCVVVTYPFELRQVVE